MTAVRGSDDRVVLPRWRLWQNSQSSGELLALEDPTASTFYAQTSLTPQDELSQRLHEFETSPGIFEAADVVSTALALGLGEFPGVHDAAIALQASNYPLGRAIASQVLLGRRPGDQVFSQELRARAALDATQTEDADRVQVARLRRLVNRQPRNSLRWADLALAHTIIGNTEHAARALRVALALGKGNRFILRAAARFYTHQGDWDAALKVLTTDRDRFLGDPWLMAAEIAISDLAQRPLIYANRGRRLLDGDFSPRHTSELASALATVEFKAGKIKQARRHFSQALKDPTENALAQAEWSVERGLNVQLPEEIRPPLDFEAEARHALRSGDFDSATIQSGLWQEDQPFAIFPAQHTSYIAATLAEDYPAAIRACQKGLISNPGNSILLNNLAFARANTGSVDEANAIMLRLTTADDPQTLLTLTATRGLIEFRRGNLATGRWLYQNSISGWQRLENRKEQAARAAIYLAREEVRANTDHIDAALAQVQELCSHIPSSSEVHILRQRLPQHRT